MASTKTVIVTGASRGIGAAVAHAFLDRDYNIVGTSLSFSGSGVTASAKLALVDGDISLVATAETVVQAARKKFGAVDHVVHCAGIFSSKPFVDYSIEEFRSETTELRADD